MNTITLYRGPDVYLARYTGPHRRVMLDLFGTDTLPTPFGKSCNPATVATLIAQRNPECRVELAP